MASKGYLDQVLNPLPPDIRRPVATAFQYEHDNWRLGDGARASNAQWYKFSAITSSNANGEFTIAHKQGQTPSKLIPVLDLNAIGSQLVRLAVTRAPDSDRVYLSSDSTSATITVYLEF